MAWFTAVAYGVLTALAPLGVVRGAAPSSELAERPRAEGTLRPLGSPREAPSRTDAGGSCIVDLVQEYELSGTLSGSATIDYRILVRGPCGSPPGTFPEEWIAHGKLTGMLNENEATATFTYIAQVALGGQVDGKIVLGDGLDGQLEVAGRFADRRLRYAGWVR